MTVDNLVGRAHRKNGQTRVRAQSTLTRFLKNLVFISVSVAPEFRTVAELLKVKNIRNKNKFTNLKIFNFLQVTELFISINP